MSSGLQNSNIPKGAGQDATIAGLVVPQMDALRLQQRLRDGAELLVIIKELSDAIRAKKETHNTWVNGLSATEKLISGAQSVDASQNAVPRADVLSSRWGTGAAMRRTEGPALLELLVKAGLVLAHPDGSVEWAPGKESKIRQLVARHVSRGALLTNENREAVVLKVIVEHPAAEGIERSGGEHPATAHKLLQYLSQSGSLELLKREHGSDESHQLRLILCALQKRGAISQVNYTYDDGSCDIRVEGFGLKWTQKEAAGFLAAHVPND
jgi:hypothetical protein